MTILVVTGNEPRTAISGSVGKGRSGEPAAGGPRPADRRLLADAVTLRQVRCRPHLFVHCRATSSSAVEIPE